MGAKLKALIIEDSEDDLELLLRQLRRGGYDPSYVRATTQREMQAALKVRDLDIILSDYALPQFSGLAALNLYKERELDIPFIVISGTIGEDTAVEMMRAGASDYLMKNNLARLAPAIERELREFEVRRERKRAESVQAAVYKISEAANAATDMDSFYRMIHGILGDVIPAENFYIALYDTATDQIEFPFYTDQHKSKPLPHKAGHGLTEYVLRTGEPLLATPDVFKNLIERKEVIPRGAACLDWLGVPLKSNTGETIGVMAVQTYLDDVRFGKRELDILGFISDQVELVIQRKLAEVSLRESEQKFSMFMDNLPIAAYIKDADCRMVYVNRHFLQAFSGVDWIGKTVKDVYPRKIALPIDTDDREALTGKVIQRTEKFSRPEGEVVFETTRFQIPREDQSPLLGGISTDVTDRIKADEQLRQAAEELSLAYDATLEGWSYALELRERETAGHSQRVMAMTISLAGMLGIEGDELIHIRRGALLHDIGKMGVPDSILLKPGPLTDDEWVIMRQHPILAFQLLNHIPYLHSALDIPYCHHEKWDGSGYPRGLKGEEIPVAARIFTLVDVWDALLSNRPYRPAWNEKAVREYVTGQRGKHFDPQIVKVFMKYQDQL